MSDSGREPMNENSEFFSELIRDEYKEAVIWIRTMWTVRFSLLSAMAGGLVFFSIDKNNPELLIYFLLPVTILIDYGCLLPTLPFIYIAIYYECNLFASRSLPRDHHIISNWHAFAGMSLDKLIISRDSFRKHFIWQTTKYRLKTFYLWLVLSAAAIYSVLKYFVEIPEK